MEEKIVVDFKRVNSLLDSKVYVSLPRKKMIELTY